MPPPCASCAATRPTQFDLLAIRDKLIRYAKGGAQKHGVHHAEEGVFQYLIDEVFRRDREKRKESGQFHTLRLELDPSTENKEERLAAMEPATTSGIIEFAEHLPPALFQGYNDFDGVPNGHHDDGEDAIQGAFARSGGMPPMMVQERIL